MSCEPIQHDISLKDFIDLLSSKCKLTFRDCIKVYNIFNNTEAYIKIQVIINYNSCKKTSIHPSTILNLSVDKIKKCILVDSMNLNVVTYQELLLFLDETQIHKTRVFYDPEDFDFENAKICRHSTLICRPHKFICGDSTEQERNFYVLESDNMIYDGITSTGRFDSVMNNIGKIKLIKSNIIKQLKEAGFRERHVVEPSFTHFCINGTKVTVIYEKDKISIGFVDQYICITTRPVGPNVVNHEWEKFVMYNGILDFEIADYIEKYTLASIDCSSCEPVTEEDAMEGCACDGI